jgi:hypothetical protein
MSVVLFLVAARLMLEHHRLPWFLFVVFMKSQLAVLILWGGVRFGGISRDTRIYNSG